MSGKKAKLARKALRAAGGEDKVTRKLRLIQEQMKAERRAAEARAEAMANETPEQRAEREEQSRLAMRRMAGFMSAALALTAGLPLPHVSSQARNPTPRNRRGL